MEGTDLGCNTPGPGFCVRPRLRLRLSRDLILQPKRKEKDAPPRGLCLSMARNFMGGFSTLGGTAALFMSREQNYSSVTHLLCASLEANMGHQDGPSPLPQGSPQPGCPWEPQRPGAAPMSRPLLSSSPKHQLGLLGDHLPPRGLSFFSDELTAMKTLTSVASGNMHMNRRTIAGGQRPSSFCE